MGGDAFIGCYGLTSVTIHYGLKIIRPGTFALCDNLKSVNIPSSVTIIYQNAFDGCTSLTSITLPSSVTTIGECAFLACSGLTSVTAMMKDPVKIEEYTFDNSYNAILYVPYGCKARYKAADYWKDFKEIIEISPIIEFADANVKALCIASWDTNEDGELDEEEAAEVTDIGTVFSGNTTIKTFNELQYFTGLTAIGDYAFSNCTSLTSVTIPSGLTSIGEDAFSFCSSLTSVTIPSGMTSIGEYAFDSCSGLTSITVNEGNSKYDSRNNCNAIIETATHTLIAGCKNTIIPNTVLSIGGYAFSGCSDMTSVSIPSSVKSIGEGAFGNCTSLTSVVIPSSVTSIGGWAFYGCGGLTSVTAMMETPINIYSSTFSNRQNATLYVPYGCKAAYEAANSWKKFKEIIELPAPITETDISQMDNVIYIEPTEARCGSKTTLSVKMKNNVAIQTIQFDLYLPDGVTIVPNEDDELVTASKERINRFSYFESSMQSDGALRLLAQATSTNVPAGDGEICRIVVDIPESMEEGDYPLVIKGALMVEKDNTSHSPDPNLVQTKLTVLNYVPGDANNDGDVNAIDFNMIGNYILGQCQSGFNVKVADISGDGDVNAIDFNMVGNMILNGATASASRKKDELSKEAQ